MAMAVLAFCVVAHVRSVDAQNTITMTPSITSGDGQLTIDMSWSTNPPLTTGTPCTASAVPATQQWTGAKAGAGSVTAIGPFTADQRLALQCGFPGDSIVTFTWTPATTNTNGSAYTNRALTRIRHTFNATLPTNPLPACNTGGVSCVEIDDSTPTRPTMRTVTGITQTGTMRAVATHVNTNGAESAASSAATKAFQGSVTVTQQVDLIVRSVPNVVTGFSMQ
jgi:hypothetical protein